MTKRMTKKLAEEIRTAAFSVPKPKKRTPDKRETARFIDRAVRIKSGIAKHRDQLRELLGELEEVEYDCATAINDLERTADALSKYL